MQAAFISPQDPRWLHFLGRTRHDFYHLPNYLTFCARHEGGTPLAFWYADGDYEFLAPMLIRDLPAELGGPADWRDAITPYGYPCPLHSEDSPKLAGALAALRETGREQGLVTIFFRLHPLLPLEPDNLLRAQGTLLQHSSTVTIDLTLPPETQWSQIRKGHRYEIRKLAADGFTAAMDDWSRLDDFIDLYLSTMSRVNASEFYYFSKAYFEELRGALGDSLHLGTVDAPDGNLACAGLFTVVQDDIVQYHLSGTADPYSHRAPTKLMLDHVRRWATALGCRAFHLGGGVGNREDSLFQFKAGFSPLLKEFRTYRLVLDKERYAELGRLWQVKTGVPVDDTSDFFPLYRRPLAPEG